MMLYLRMIHQAFQPVAAFVNKMILVAGVILAITGFFLHYHMQDLPHQQADKQTSQMRKLIYTVLDDPNMKKNYSALATRSFFKSGVCFILGEGCTDNPKDGDNRYTSSLIGGVGNLMALPYTNPPASGIAWVHDSFQNVGFVPHTYAAGVGFYSISSFSNVWKLFRNITFFVMAIAIVVVGFLIMFRVKIDSQTVINLENSLPRIVITLLLITFSFAIAGFLVDMMYVLLLMTTSILGSVKDTGIQSLDATQLQSVYLTNEYPLFEQFFSGAYVSLYTQGIRGLIEIIPQAVKGVAYPFIYIFIYLTASSYLRRFLEPLGFDVEGSVVFASIKGNLGAFIYFLVVNIFLVFLVPIFIYQVIPWVVGLIVILTLFFRIFFMLITAYVQIVINIIFAPVLILPNVLPGNNSFIDWFKRLAGNLLTFPITAVLLITVQLIGLNDEFIGSRTAIDAGTYNGALSQFSMPMLALTTSQMVPIIAAVFMLIIPDLVEKVVEGIAGPPVIDAGVGKLFSSAGGGVGSIVAQYAGLAQFTNTMHDTAFGKAFGWLPGVKRVKDGDRHAESPVGGAPNILEVAKEEAKTS